MGMRTSLEEERAEQARWRLLPNMQDVTLFDELLMNEFRDPVEIARMQAARLFKVLEHAAAHVPYYQRSLGNVGLDPSRSSSAEVLGRLPILTKVGLQENVAALQARALPQGDKVYGWVESSGTTGRSTRVLHSFSSARMFQFLEQRQLRWFRWNPKRLRADIRIATQFPSSAGKGKGPLGSNFRMERWRYVGLFFETGDYIGLCVTNPIEKQTAWLREMAPDYLMAFPSTLEGLAFELGQNASDIGINGVYAISEQMTAAMRRRTEESFGVPIDQTYGLNEIGKVGQRCRAGRYHVNAEHCLVEVVDEEGQSCRPGELGRLVVTGLRNLAMPLLRYETGDLAQAVEGPCPCGRSLPSFGAVSGRYRRMAHTPQGTWAQLLVLRSAIETMPQSLSANLRSYQIRQLADASYVVLLKVDEQLPAGFRERLAQRWKEGIKSPRPALTLRTVDSIPLSASGKLEQFVSEIAQPELEDSTD